MIIYIIILLAIIMFSLIINRLEIVQNKKNKIILIFSLFLIFICGAFSSNNVGIDVFGYSKSYLEIKEMAWADFNYFHFERGYILLVKIFSKLLNLPFYMFKSFYWLINVVAVYVFVHKFSKDVTLSLIIYYCFNFFGFTFSGMRNSLALSICLFAYTFFIDKQGWKNNFYFFLFIAIAVSLHKSALVVLPMFLIIKLKNNIYTKLCFIIFPLICFVFRNQIYQFIDLYIKEINNFAPISIGGSFIALVGLFLSCYFIKKIDSSSNYHSNTSEDLIDINLISIRMLIMAIFILGFSSGGNDILTRMCVYGESFLMIYVPYCLDIKEKKYEYIFKIILVLFLFFLFITTTILSNSFGIVPYTF